MIKDTPIHLTSAAKRRRDLARSVVGDDASVLEIGAFDTPTFIEELGDRVKYMDWFSAEELYRQHERNPKRLLTNIVDIDYVIKRHDFAPAIPERFDLIVGAHVVEHVADVVFWLQQLETLLADGGVIYLAVPDRRYTFDYYRRTSNVIDIIRAHEERLDRPNKWQIADGMYHHTRVKVAGLWAGDPVPPFLPRFSLPETLMRSERAAREYTDVHCWVFTPDSFEEVIEQLRRCDLINLVVRRIDPPVPGTNEFSVFLSVADARAPRDRGSSEDENAPQKGWQGVMSDRADPAHPAKATGAPTESLASERKPAVQERTYEALLSDLDRVRTDYLKLRRRRSVRLSLSLAKLLRPLFRLAGRGGRTR